MAATTFVQGFADGQCGLLLCQNFVTVQPVVMLTENWRPCVRTL